MNSHAVMAVWRRQNCAGPTAISPKGGPTSLAQAVNQYLMSLLARRYAASTVRSRRSALMRFLRWCQAAALQRADDVTPSDLDRFSIALAATTLRSGAFPLSWASQQDILTALKGFFRWAVAIHLVPFDPSADLAVPRRGERVPRAVLSAREAEVVLAQADCATPLGLRDRALMELLYSTGIRRTECIRLILADVDYERGVLLVREGKGRRDRVVPIGTRALDWLTRYIWSARPLLAAAPDTSTLFLNRRGNPLLANRLSERVHRYIEAANLGKSGSCHVFRHTMATLLLEGGADIRHIQAILGHVHLSTTALYTRVSVAQLKQVHTRTHPAEHGEDAHGRAEQVDLAFDLIDPV